MERRAELIWLHCAKTPTTPEGCPSSADEQNVLDLTSDDYELPTSPDTIQRGISLRLSLPEHLNSASDTMLIHIPVPVPHHDSPVLQ